MNNPMLRGFFDFIRNIAGKVRGQEPEMISPVPKQEPTPTPDPWEEKGWTKAGGGYYRENEPGSYVDKQKIPPEQLAQLEARGREEEPQQPIIEPEKRVDVSPNSPIFDFTKYRETGTFEIPEVPSELGGAMRDIYGDDAEKIAVIAGTENPQYDATAINTNRDGSQDIGILQINSNTLADFMRRKPKQVASIGIDSKDDLFDPMKNLKMGKLILAEQGWGAWYGPSGKGYNVK